MNIFSRINHILISIDHKPYNAGLGDRREYEQPYVDLIHLADEVLYYMVREETLTAEQMEIVCILVRVLSPYTDRGTCINANPYAVTHKENTCTYKLARELLFGFQAEKYEDLRRWVLDYYFDHFLVEEALKLMISIDRQKALAFAVEHAMPGHLGESKKKMQKKYWQLLKECKNLTYDLLSNISIKSDMNFSIQKDCWNLIIKNNLLKGHKDKEDRMKFYEQVIKPARNKRERTFLKELKNLGSTTIHVE